MGKLNEYLTQPETVQPKPQAKYNPTSEYDPQSGTGFIQTGAVKEIPTFDALLESFGYDPAEVQIIGTLKTSRWQQREDGDWLQSYRFALGPANRTNIDELVEIVNKRKFKRPESTTEGNPLHWLAGDLQLGKSDGDGTEGIVDRVLQSIDNGVQEYKNLRKFRKINMVHLAWLGDCIEGNVSQGGKNLWRTELTITEQYRLFRRLLMYSIESFAPLVERLDVDVVNGNHDQAQRLPVATRGDDGHATEAAIAVIDALKLNEQSFGGVSIYVPNVDESMITRQIGSTVMTHLHGHQIRRGKAFDWWANQTLNNQSVGASHFLLRGHEHEFRIHAKRDRTEICVPTFESRSQYWVDTHGDIARTGALMMLTEEERFSDLKIV